MRTRLKGYAFYGFRKGEAEALVKRCATLGAAESALLRRCANEANEGAAEAVHYGLTHGLSYERLSARIYPRYGKSDYYAYRRKTIAIFRDALAEGGLYGERRAGKAPGTGKP